MLRTVSNTECYTGVGQCGNLSIIIVNGWQLIPLVIVQWCSFSWWMASHCLQKYNSQLPSHEYDERWVGRLGHYNITVYGNTLLLDITSYSLIILLVDRK